MNPNHEKLKYCGSSFRTNIFAAIGTIFLWMYWPSFNGALEFENGKSRAAINTQLGMLASVLAALATSFIVNKGKFNME